MTGAWHRDLDADLLAIKEWGANHLITLLEPQELEELRIQLLAVRAQALGLKWHGLPIRDGAAPDDRFLRPWATLAPSFAAALNAGEKIVVHCKGGLGRAGTVACLLLLETGAAADADRAMHLVRAVRKGAVESLEQESFLHSWRAGTADSGQVEHQFK